MNAEQKLSDLMTEFRMLKTEEEQSAFDDKMRQALADMNQEDRNAFRNAFLTSARQTVSEAKKIKVSKLVADLRDSSEFSGNFV